ncbi:MAG: hypothetical protein HDKAJFGB_03274 [Anaerolineae bacterium]|nr:hypothetical protein [Anaerolineae bacterium]
MSQAAPSAIQFGGAAPRAARVPKIARANRYSSATLNTPKNAEKKRVANSPAPASAIQPRSAKYISGGFGSTVSVSRHICASGFWTNKTVNASSPRSEKKSRRNIRSANASSKMAHRRRKAREIFIRFAGLPPASKCRTENDGAARRAFPR